MKEYSSSCVSSIVDAFFICLLRTQFPIPNSTLLASENSILNSKTPSDEDMLGYNEKKSERPFFLWFMKMAKVREVEAIKAVEDVGWL